MPEFAFESEPTTPSLASPEPDDTDDEAAAWEALAEDRRRQAAEQAVAQSGTGEPTAPSPEAAPTLPTEDAVRAPADAGRGRPDQAAATTPPAAPTDTPPSAATSPNRRVFVIDQKEYPDPDPDLPITGTRSVQALYRDYFPGQLDNADVVQKTRPDGTVEVVFKRRIGTKGARRRRPAPGADAPMITSAQLAGVLERLAPDRPLAWALVEQALDCTGRVRLDFVPPAAELNLAEAQQRARQRLIEQAVGQLRTLRPSL